MTDDFDDELPYGGEPPAQSHSRTSIAAADRLRKRVGPLHQKVLRYLQTNLAGATDEMLCDELGLVGNTERPWRRELQLMGYIEDRGRVARTRSGRDAVVWIIARAA
jgi:hypothetical protein